MHVLTRRILPAAVGYAALLLLSSFGQCVAEVVIKEGPDWVPLQPGLDIESGSALDFTGLAGTGVPAGREGWVVARSDGQFAFERSPRVPRRFYGVNFCFGAHYISHEESDRLALRLSRLGYNTLRIHHYEGELASGQTNSTDFNQQKLDQLDYLAAAMIQHGIYLTTDLFVSRRIRWREFGMDREGFVPMNTFKICVPVHEGAFENWKAFSRAFLDHKNPYTGRRYADEPALAWLAMINEGNLGNFVKEMQTVPEWKTAWNHWLKEHYLGQDDLAKTWGTELKSGEKLEENGIVIPESIYASGPRVRDFVLFLGAMEKRTVKRMKDFLRGELRCRALISNASSWTRFATDQDARTVYDYVDDHFYVDHPKFLEQEWRLPSRCPNTSPIAEGAAGGRSLAFTRLFDKPFTVTEYNYSGPGRFRGVGGILTGALGALQGWSGIWRFAYSHSREAMIQPGRMNYFDLAGDPLSQAAERASLCLFLRGDLRTAPHSVVVAMTPEELAHPPAKVPGLAPDWHWLAWVTRVGTQVVRPGTDPRHSVLVPLNWDPAIPAFGSASVFKQPAYSLDKTQFVAFLADKKVFPQGQSPDPVKKWFRSETGEITIDAAKDTLVLDTPRTAGGYATAGQDIEAAASGVRIGIRGTDATVWVSALDGKPINSSKRLLVTHLTDLQNSEIRYAEADRKTLLDWGRLPHLVRSGGAKLSIPLKRPSGFKVWALEVTGKRRELVTSRIEGKALCFEVDVAGNRGAGAVMLYEIARE
jgi:hypothetical protein